jgi:AAA domain, putative AbiEii toxin, Type IV TA system
MSWPIDTLTIQRFRGLRGLTLESVGGVNLLVGDNNSGKTSVLEAISIYCEPLDPLAWRRVAQRRVRGFRTISIIDGVKWLFPQEQAPAEATQLFSGEIALNGAGRAGLRDVRAMAREVEVEEIDDTLQAPWRRRREETIRPESVLTRGINLTFRLTTSQGTVEAEAQFLDRSGSQPHSRALSGETGLRVEIISPFDHGIEELYIGRFRRAVLGDHKADVIEALQRVDPGIFDLEFLPLPSPSPVAPYGGAIYLRHKRSGRTPLSAFGDGVRRVLLMALTLVSARGGDLLIDEIETAIHVSVLGGVFTWLVGACRAYDVQLFATTHSLEALDAILAADKENLGTIVGYRFPSPEHATPVRRYEGEQLSRLRFERGLDVR